MMRSLIAAAALVALVLTAACSSTGSNGSSMSGGSSERNVLDMTWGNQKGYASAQGRSRDRYDDLVQTMEGYDRQYYETRIRTKTASGDPIAPIDQIQFKKNLTSNVSTGDVTITGSTTVNDPDEPTFIDQNGNRVKLSSFRGKPLVMVFTRGFPGYLCPMCTAYTAQFVVNYERFRKAGAEVVIVFPGSSREVDSFVAASKEIADLGENPPFPILLDPDLVAVSRFRVNADLARPSTFIFDSQGVRRWGYTGREPEDRPDIETVLAEVAKVK
ncbi:MAG: peroxiredoxin family protein [Planctomycetota bacterium]